MKKSLLRKLVALLLVVAVCIVAHNPVHAFAGPNVPTTTKSVATSSSSSLYQINTDGYTYSLYKYTPASGEKVALRLTSSYPHSITVKVYNSSGLQRTYTQTLDDEEVVTIRPNVSGTVYFKFENAGNNVAIASYKVFSD